MSQDPFQEREAEKYANPIPSREFILEHLTKFDLRQYRFVTRLLYAFL